MRGAEAFPGDGGSCWKNNLRIVKKKPAGSRFKRPPAGFSRGGGSGFAVFFKGVLQGFSLFFLCLAIGQVQDGEGQAGRRGD